MHTLHLLSLPLENQIMTSLSPEEVDDSAIVSFITDGEEGVYRELNLDFVHWCKKLPPDQHG